MDPYHEVRFQLLEVGCFTQADIRTNPGPFKFELTSGDFYVLLMCEHTNQGKRNILEWHHNQQNGVVSFEDVLDSVSPEIQEKLLFCLNLFCRPK